MKRGLLCTFTLFLAICLADTDELQRPAPGKDWLAVPMEKANAEIVRLKKELSDLYTEAQQNGVDAQEKLSGIQAKRDELHAAFQKVQLLSGQFTEEEAYAFWYGKITTIRQLLIEFGEANTLYSIPDDVAQMTIQLQGALPIASSCWPDMIHALLWEKGIGVEKVNPYLHRLYKVKGGAAAPMIFVEKVSGLDSLNEDAHAAIVIHFPAAESKKLRFLETAGAAQHVNVHAFEREVLLSGSAARLANFARLAEFILFGQKSSKIRPITLQKMTAKEATTLVEGALGQRPSKFSTSKRGEIHNLRAFALSDTGHMLILSGEEKEIEQAENLIKDVESNLQDPVEKTVYWYTCKHSSAEDIAKTLSKIYPKLLSNNIRPQEAMGDISEDEEEESGSRSVSRANSDSESKDFIVDAKTGSIIMAVERRALPEIKSLLKRLDVPKKMVQIEVLLFEKTTRNNNQFGLKNFGLGSGAKTTEKSGLNYDGLGNQDSPGGILDFFFSRLKRGAIPAYDLAYRFMLSNRDIQLNACPSITTINAVPAVISITNEISVDNGITYLEGKDRSVPKQSFSRERYGITITVTPTIHDRIDEQEDEGSITLETNINFESINRNQHNRPDVTKRHIENQVRIQNGKTVIIGGLRQKDASGNANKIPFLGQIPGIGKLFSYTEMDDLQTEMFIFITPKIIEDKKESLEKLQKDELKRRPGDLPDFIKAKQRSEAQEKERLFERSIELLTRSSDAITSN